MRAASAIAWLALAVMLAPLARAQGLVDYLQKSDETATSAAAVVDGSAYLAHTAQVFPTRGGAVARGTPEAQAGILLDNLVVALRAAGSGLDRLVKLNVYAATDEAAAAFQKTLAARLAKSSARPALALVVGALAAHDALLAADAVAVASQPESNASARVKLVDVPMTQAGPGCSALAIMPPGGKVYVSGQAERGDLRQATQGTLKSLAKTLDFLGLDLARVVQVKAFMQPIASADLVQREVAAFFGGHAPPLVLVEWRMNTPIEIELVAAAQRRETGQALEFLTPPELKPSPVFSRVARVNRGPVIYFGGLYGPPGASGRAQTEAIFHALGPILTAAGSDFRHLAKATYYVSSEDASKALNDLRPNYYDPKRPPAASKASVTAVGRPGCTITLDLIGVPARGD